MVLSYPENGSKLGDSSRRWLNNIRQQMTVSANSRIFTLDDTPKKSLEHALLSKPVVLIVRAVPIANSGKICHCTVEQILGLMH